MTTVGDQIDAALRLSGVLAEEGETPSAPMIVNALDALNQMIDSWNTESLMIYNTIDQVFTWPSNQITRTLGPTGDFIGIRPVSIDDSTYFRDPASGISYGIQFINQELYDGIALKSAGSSYPQMMWVNMEYPNISMTLYPKPTRALEWHIVSAQEIVQPVTPTDVLYLPPGYKRAFKYNLACELAPEFGVEPSPTVQRIAMVSKRNLKRQNNPGDVMSMPRSLMAAVPKFNIFSGNY